jgi:hypothetical protein
MDDNRPIGLRIWIMSHPAVQIDPARRLANPWRTNVLSLIC